MTANNNNSTQQQNTSDIAITPELIKQVTDKVYALLMKDLQIERERLRGTKNPFDRKESRK